MLREESILGVKGVGSATPHPAHRSLNAVGASANAWASPVAAYVWIASCRQLKRTNQIRRTEYKTD